MKSQGLSFSAISKFRSEIMGFACLWVVLHHFQGDFSSLFLKRLSVYGNAGVDIFLFLSGISLYFAFQKKEPLSKFYEKRVVRLLLPYLFICVPFYIWKSVYLGEGNLWLDLTQLSFPLNHMITTWYVPTIFVFYLIFPLIYRFQNGMGVQNRFVRVSVFCFLYLIALLIVNDLFPTFYNNTEIALVRFIIFFIGCYFGKAVFNKKTVPVEWLAVSLAYILIWVLLRESVNLSTLWIRLSYGPLAISICVLSAFTFNYLKEQSIFLKILRFFGNHSLEIYLTHVLIYNVWRNTLGVRFLSSGGGLDYLAVVLISVILSLPIHYSASKLYTFAIRNR